MLDLISTFYVPLTFPVSWIWESQSHLCQGRATRKASSFQSRQFPPKHHALTFFSPPRQRCRETILDLVSLTYKFCVSVISNSTSTFRHPNSKLDWEDSQLFAQCTWSLKRQFICKAKKALGVFFLKGEKCFYLLQI
jgi:hypothetical protein